MANEMDEVHDSVRTAVRTAIAAAAQVAQRVARAREQQLREAQAASQQRAAELRTRFEAERSAALASLAPVMREDWWATAGPQQIAEMYQTAHAWEDADTAVHAHADRIRTEVQTRFNLDSGALDTVDALRAEAQATGADAGADERLAAAILTAPGDRREDQADEQHEQVHEVRAAALWDSAARREDLATKLEHTAPVEAVQVRMLVDTGQGKPARQAVARPPHAAATRPAVASNARAAHPRPSAGQGR